MALILAVDPDGARRAALDEVRLALAGHELTVVDAPQTAIAAIDRRLPDAVLLPAELDPDAAGAICTHLRDRAGHDVPTLLIPALDEVGEASDPRAIAAEVEAALREPLVAAARALVAWIRGRRRGLADVPLAAPAAASAVAAAAPPTVRPALDDEPEPEPEVEREPWLGPAIAAIGRGAGSAIGAAASGAGTALRAVGSPLLRWAPRLAVAAAAIGLVSYAGLKGRPYVMQWIEDFRNRPVATAPADAAPAPESAEPAAPAAANAMAGSSIPGWVAVFAPFEVSASERGRAVRIDEHNLIMLSPGAHDITFRNQRFGFEDTRRIDIEPAKTTRVSILPPRSSITISANEPAEVWLDGEPVGQTPLLDLPADVGTREVRLRNAAGVERSRMIIVTVAPVTVDVDFSAP